MAKKSSTIHVESFVWDEIERIQKDQDISSRNTAIEYLVAEYRGLKSKSTKMSMELVEEFKKTSEEKVKPIDPLTEKINNMEVDMPD